MTNDLKFYQTKIRVRYGETDQMGIVYYGNYPQYFEVGRVEWLRNLGVYYRQMEQDGIILPVVSLNIIYKKPARYDDLITVNTILKRIPSTTIEFDYEITNENNELLTKGNTVLVFVNAQTKKPTKCPQYIIDKLTEI